MARVLIACEFSATVRDAFRERGHDAWSVDLLPTEGDPRWHVQGDALDLAMNGTWDLLIAHPPCTYLANSGVRWLYGGKGTQRDPERWQKMREAALFFARLLTVPVAHVAVENPIMHSHGQAAIESFVRDCGLTPYYYDRQTIQPWQFGHGEVKATQLWLHGLPALRETDVVTGREARVHRMGPSADRWRERSRTYPGIAAAMADQWGALL